MTSVRRPELAAAAFAGLLAVATSFALGGRTPGFVAAPVGTVVTNLTPGIVMATAISTLGDLAQQLAFLFAVGLTVGLFGAVALAAFTVGGRTEMPFTATVVGAVGAWGLAAWLTRRPVAAAGVAAALAAVLAGAEWRWRAGRGGDIDTDRRSVLRAAAGVVGLSGAGFLFGTRLTDANAEPLRSITDTQTEREARSRVQAAGERSLDVDGLESIVSDKFYQVDINSVDPKVDPDEWTLSVTGAVENEFELTYDELLAMEMEHRFTTLRCVGDDLNGKKVDNALWTGVPAGKLLERARPESGCECVMLRAADDYYEEFPLPALDDGFLAVGMNGEVLPRGHGYPVRTLVPGHWGEVNLKWLTEIEVLEEEATGYWEKKGWHGTGPVNTVAKIYPVNHLDGRIQVGGHAYAGTRGVQRVEVSVDGGQTWDEADLSDPLPGTTVPDESTEQTRTPAEGLSVGYDGVTDVWRQWVYEFEPTQDEHEVVARAVDGTGTVQPEDETNAYPSGASGWVSKTVQRQG